ncbi:MAG: hypothetical protein AAFP92_26275, partial [Bacteroidota bacterium]
MKRFIYFCLLFAMGAPLAMAQGNDPLGGKDTLVLENERIEDVIDSEKPYLKPPYQEIKKGNTENIDYRSQNFYIDTDFTPSPPDIKPLEKEKAEKLNNNFIKLGLGRYMTPLGKLYINNGRDRGMDYGLDFTHLSAHQDAIPLRKFREDYGTARVNLIERKYKLDAKVHLYNTRFFNYGDTVLRDNPVAREDSLRNGFTRFQVAANMISNYDPEADYVYDVGADFNIFGGNNGNREIQIQLKPKVGYQFNEDVKFMLHSEVAYVNGKIGADQENRFFVDALPHVDFDNGTFAAKGGLQLNYFGNSADTSASFLGGLVEVSYAIVPEGLTFIAGYTSGMQANTYRDFMTENRYIQQEITIKPTIERFNIYAGVKGNIAQQVDFHARVYQKRMENQAIYFTNEFGAFFDVLYDTVNITGATVELNYDLQESIKAGAALNINVYNTKEVEKFFHAAPLRLDLFAQYNINDQFQAKGELFFVGPRPMSLDPAGEVITAGPFIDLSVSADYRITPGFSVFLSVNNLLNSNY